MICVFDVGNTNMSAGVWNKQDLVGHWRIRTDTMRTCDEYAIIVSQLFGLNGLGFKQIDAVVISSVVPTVMMELECLSTKYFKCKPLIVEAGIRTGLAIKYDNPREVGADRVVNAVAGYHKYGGPLIIVDFGTATTFCVINHKGEYLGGAIAPGIKISTEALVSRTAKLPRVELVKPKSLVGKNTISIQAGIIWLCRRVEGIKPHEKGIGLPGGGHRWLASNCRETDCIDVIDDLLTMEGLRLIYN